MVFLLSVDYFGFGFRAIISYMKGSHMRHVLHSDRIEKIESMETLRKMIMKNILMVIPSKKIHGDLINHNLRKI